MISVIVVNYQSARLTERAVRSVFQSKEDIEVIVVDNTSTAVEKELLHECLKAYDVTLILNKDNVGFAMANNQAFALAKGDLIFLLNPDAYVAPSCLGILKEFIETQPDAGSVSPQVYWDDEMTFLFPNYHFPSPFQDLCSRLSEVSTAFESLYSLHERKKNIGLWRSQLPLKARNLHGGVVMLRRSSVEESGGLFDERFFLFYEDTDLFLRLRKNGNKLYIVPAAKAVHNYRHKVQKLEIMAETLGLYYEKHHHKNVLRKLTGLIPDQTSRRPQADVCAWNIPPSFPVPEKLKRGYLFEWSPSPLFIPSIGCFGSGESFDLSQQVWDFLDPGIYYSRITEPDKILPKVYSMLWRKEK
jgi:GT2 family glycosyltransferase